MFLSLSSVTVIPATPQVAFPDWTAVIIESNSEKKLISKKFYEQNDLVAKQIFEKNGEIYSSDSSASLTIFNKGKIKTEVFYLNGKIGRINRPAIINYYVNDKTSLKIHLKTGFTKK